MNSGDALKTDRNCFSAGDMVLLQDRKDRRYLTTLADGQVFHSHLGRLDHDGLIGHSVGGWYRTDRGHTLLAVRPTLGEFVRQMPRGPQILLQGPWATSWPSPIFSLAPPSWSRGSVPGR